MITATAVMPKKFNRYAFDRAFFNAADIFGDRIRGDFHRTIATWHNRPQFKKRLRQTANETRVEVYTEGKTPPGVRPKTPEDIYCILAGGTSKNYAVMTDPFQAKTIPNVIDSVAGVGGFSHLNMDEARAMEMAIEARNWDRAIRERREPMMKPLFEAALRIGARNSGHRYV